MTMIININNIYLITFIYIKNTITLIINKTTDYENHSF